MVAKLSLGMSGFLNSVQRRRLDRHGHSGGVSSLVEMLETRTLLSATLGGDDDTTDDESDYFEDEYTGDDDIEDVGADGESSESDEDSSSSDSPDVPVTTKSLAPARPELTTNEWLVGLGAAADIDEIASAVGATATTAFDPIPGSYIVHTSETYAVGLGSSLLAAADGVSSVYPVVIPEQITHLIPDDPLFPEQWHLQNSGQSGGTAGEDANIVDVWDDYLGTNVVIGILDDGLQIDHPDLVTNYRDDLSFDFNDLDADPSPVNATDNHGTSVAGVAGATGNNTLGVSGSAPDADLAGLRILGGPISSFGIANALGFQTDQIDIYNNSWGPGAPGSILFGDRPIEVAAIRDGATNGRDGLGSVYVFSAGNGLQSNGNVNYNQLANSRHTIAVGAINHFGAQTFYSTPGASVLVAAHSNGAGVGITTTDRTGDDGYNSDGTGDGDAQADVDYTSTFGGTSSSAPLVSGIIALMLEANPNLTARDVQHIIVNTARMNDAGDSDWQVNGAGHDVNHKYGFGAIDADAAVAAALAHENVAPEVSVSAGRVTVNQNIPENDPVGVTSEVSSDSQVRLEYVEVVFSATHTFRGDLEIVLTSPSGTESVLAGTRTQDGGSNYDNWSFTSARHWDELSAGTWTITVRDQLEFDVGTFDSWELIFHGTEPGINAGLPDTIPENNGTVTGRIRRPAILADDVELTLNLASNDETELVVPAQVVLPAGEPFVDYEATVIDDNLLDGTQTVEVTVSAAGFETVASFVDVTDHEVVSISIDPTEISENGGVATATLSRSNIDDDPLPELVVTLASSDTSEASVQNTVTLAEGEITTTVVINAVDDNLLDGAQTVSLSTAAENYIPQSAELTVLDFETLVVAISEDSFPEDAGQKASSVTITRSAIEGPFDFPSPEPFIDSSETPLQILDNDVVISTIDLDAGFALVSDVRVMIDIDHDFTSDLDVTLVSPDGTRVELVSDVGLAPGSFAGTMFDDEADFRIITADTPFAGTFLPESPLSAFDGETASGLWTLEITDDKLQHVGTLNSWSIYVDTLGLAPIALTVTSDDETEAEVNANGDGLAIPFNRAATTVYLDAIDDDLLDGTQTVTVTATSDVTGVFSGVDTVDVTDSEGLQLSFNPSSVPETAASITGNVQLDAPAVGDLIVNLESDAADQLYANVPAQVIVPDGETLAEFTIGIVDNDTADPTRTVTVTATAAGFNDSPPASFEITDFEAHLQITLPVSSVGENATPFTATVARLDAPTDADLVVTLNSSDESELTVPQSVTIPAGDVEAEFVVTPADDSLLDSTQTVTLTAGAADFLPGTATMDVTDSETFTFAIDRDIVSENAGEQAAIGTVTLSITDNPTPLTVSLTLNDEAANDVSIPNEVTILPNTAVVSFPIGVVNDLEHESLETVTISAEVAGFGTKADSFDILDYEPPVLTGPSARVEDTTPSFNWTEVPNATGYEILIADLDAGRATVLQSPVEGLEFTVPETLPNGEPLDLGNYIAWVRALENGDEGPWSTPVVFEVIVTPDPIAPTGTISELRPTFSWSPIPDAVNYELWVNHLDTTRNPALHVTGITGTSYTPTEDLLSGNYQYWVRGVDANGIAGEFGDPGEFTLLARPTVIQPIGETSDRTPTITWSAVADAAQYEVSVVDLSTGLAVDLVAGDNKLNAIVTETTSFTPQSDLPLSEFRVFVRSITTDGAVSQWSVPRRFETIEEFSITTIQPVSGPLPQEPLESEPAISAVPLTWQPDTADEATALRVETFEVAQPEESISDEPASVDADDAAASESPADSVQDQSTTAQKLTFVAEASQDLDSLFADPLAEW